VDVTPLSIAGAWTFTPREHHDSRGTFLESFTTASFAEATGRDFDMRQTNCSVSAAGVLRGVHYADVPPGQAKYVMCTSGAVLDVVVDIRVGSPTFGHWDAVLLDDIDRRATYLSEGLGHAFFSLADGSTVLYLCSTPYAPDREHAINPLDPEIGIDWPTTDRHGRPITPQLSDKDANAISLTEARDAGMLPKFDAVTTYVEQLNTKTRSNR